MLTVYLAKWTVDIYLYFYALIGRIPFVRRMREDAEAHYNATSNVNMAFYDENGKLVGFNSTSGRAPKDTFDEQMKEVQ